MTTHRLPRAVHSDEHLEAHADLDGMLAAVRRTAVDLLVKSPVPPTTLNVRAGEVSVEMGWATGEAVAVAQAPAAPAPAQAPAGETVRATTVGSPSGCSGAIG
jgi:acetyl-CoA carboxylase biotin carboxyl carrier protein